MKTFEVRFVEVYHVEAEDSETAYNLALASHSDDEVNLTDAECKCIDYRHGDDTVKEL